MSKTNLILDQGSTFEVIIELTDDNNEPLNANGLTPQAQMRKHYASANAININTSLANGQLILSLPATQTAIITPGRYVYDVELKDLSNNVVRVLDGILTVTPEVTKI